MVKVVLVEPEIPQNAGNVSRTCVLTGSELHLVEPLGFSLEERHLKRAGLDYWKYLKLKVHPSWDDFLKEYDYHGGGLYFFSSHGEGCYTQLSYRPGDYLVFGSETSGFPDYIFNSYRQICRIPMIRGIERSLNLSNTVAIVVYEAVRQMGFPGME